MNKIKKLQSLFTWIFYLFQNGQKNVRVTQKASILIHLDFLSIFGIRLHICSFEGASILIHLDFLSISKNCQELKIIKSRFNPYSPGFSIYLKLIQMSTSVKKGFNPYSPGFSIYFFCRFYYLFDYYMLQSLFTWIFYLFCNEIFTISKRLTASILIHLDFLSI